MATTGNLFQCVSNLTWCNHLPICIFQLQVHLNSLVVVNRHEQLPTWIQSSKLKLFSSWKDFFETHKWPTSWAATMIPLKPPVSSMMATLLTFSKRLLTTQAPPTYANPLISNYRVRNWKSQIIQKGFVWPQNSTREWSNFTIEWTSPAFESAANDCPQKNRGKKLVQITKLRK